MSPLFRFASARAHDPAVEAWFGHDPMRELARPWFAAMRAAGPDTRELIHDGWPTACVQGAAYAYVSAHAAHVNLGFYFGAALPDPAGLLEGAGKRMRHVKVRWGRPPDEAALKALIAAAYADMTARLAAE